MITAIVILSGVALLQLYLNLVLYIAAKTAWRELKEQKEEIYPIDTVVWDDIRNQK